MSGLRAVQVSRAAECAARANELLGKSVDAIFAVGDYLLGAQKLLRHGESEEFYEHLQISEQRASNYRKIANDPRLRKLQKSVGLPASWCTLYELQKLSDFELKRAEERGAISPDMKLTDAKLIRKGEHVTDFSLKFEEPSLFERPKTKDIRRDKLFAAINELDAEQDKQILQDARAHIDKMLGVQP